MEDFQKRVVVERDELQEKVAALKRFIQSDPFLELSVIDQTELIMQFDAMGSYFNLLNNRIMRF